MVGFRLSEVSQTIVLCLLRYMAFAFCFSAPCVSLGQITYRQIKHSQAEPLRPDWMKSDADLQQPVTVTMKGRSVRFVLAEMTKKTGVDMGVSSDLAEYRISLYMNTNTLRQAMARILDVFSHGNFLSRSCYWDRVEDANHKLHYTLRRTPFGVHEEKEQLNYALATTARWLREMRDYGRLIPEKRKGFSTDWQILQNYAKEGMGLSEGETSPVAEAIMTLTDEQIDQLIRVGHVALSTFSPSHAALSQLQNSAKSVQGSNTTLTSANFSAGGELWLDAGLKEDHFGLSLRYPSGPLHEYPIGFGIDPLGQFPLQQEIDDIEEAHKHESGYVVDLLAHEKIPSGKRPEVSLATALELLHREAKLSLQSEIFLKERQILSVTTGKPEYLLSKMCGQFGLSWMKIRKDYLVWSKTWVQDRAANVSDTLLIKWNAAQKKQGRFEFSDLIEISRLSDPQIVTIKRGL